MASVDSTEQPLLEGEVSRRTIEWENYTDTYPYHCRLMHCMNRTPRCTKDSCQALITKRVNELEILLQNCWEDLFEAQDDMESLEEDTDSYWGWNLKQITGSGTLHFNPPSDAFQSCMDCASCEIESWTRDCITLRTATALARVKAQTLREYREQRDKDEHDEQFVGETNAHNGLDAVQENFEVDEEDSDRIYHQTENSDGDSIRHLPSRKKRSWRPLDLSDPLHVYKTAMSGGDRLGPTLRYERQWIREQVKAAQTTSYARTGSRRGFGAGALKPQTGRTANINSKRS